MNALNPPAKRSKKSVDYGPGMKSAHCSICTHYRSPGLCTLVEGRIRADDWCKLFHMKQTIHTIHNDTHAH